jgi:S1-C subfamily serine protease
MQNPVNTFISLGLLISVVGASFYFVSASAPIKPWTGIVDGLFLNPARAEALGLNRENGLLIVTITPDSPADKAGLRGSNGVVTIDGTQVPIGGDIIVSIDGTQINEINDVCGVLAQKQIGDSVRFEISRDSNLQGANVILEELPSGARTTC